MENNRQVFDTERLVPTYFRQALPVVLNLIVSLVYNLADTWFIARTGDTMLVAGVSLCGPLFMMLMAIGNIFGQGGSSLIARRLGSGDRDGVRRISAYCFYTAILCGAVIAAALLCFRQPVLSLLGADAETATHAEAYYTVLSAGAPVCILTFIHSNLLRSEGMAVESVVGTIAGSVLNIILDPIMISVLGWGARGAAVATVLGYVLTDVLYVLIVRKKSRFLSMDPRNMRTSGEEKKQIYSIGITAAITNIASSVCMVFMNQFLLTYGNDKIAALGIVTRIVMIVQLVLVGFSFGGVPLFGYLYGAREREKLKKLLRFCVTFLCSLGAGLSLVIFLLAEPMIRVFMNDPAILKAGAEMLRWQVSGMVFVAVVLLFTCLYQSTGKPVKALIMSLSRQGVLFLAVFLIATAAAGYSGFLAAQPTADLLSAGLALGLYKAGQEREEQEICTG